ncbi:GFA family protein [Leptolyngbya sp. FACHB-261]|uniref:GFA family protein n=1 Tax=Leptolyngbya sp. FACHB-261 TaxID=2692806 RepID=UPI001685CD7B|nr:GFA family protein [Leptolyngbya sp. FACHB-261]MBD2099728.1 GFA family protein [Leptolyngbya sp. FACHB-261]
MSVSYPGGCQCGRIRYELLAEPLTLYACHCKECQKQSSSAFGLSMTVPREAVVITQGQPKAWQRSSESGRQVTCLFCGDCGTRLFHHPARNLQIANVKAGTLDDTRWLKPVAHLWTKSAQPWLTINEQMLNYEGQPVDFSQLLERWHLGNEPREKSSEGHGSETHSG